MIDQISLVTFCFAAISALMFILNLRSFHRAGRPGDTGDALPAVSVLIPARNEADGIRKTLAFVLANAGVDLEVLVLDDHSDDATGSIVQEYADADGRVRYLRGKRLPAGWCGKQYACHQLVCEASYDELLFIDADVHLSADAIRLALTQRRRMGVDLLSGFPRQIVGTFGESLLIPLMHVVLLTYLPFVLMRRTSMKSASAGCGQLFLTTREAYQRVGGHEAVKSSLHDGVQLPRAYRQANLTTDIFDASEIASCRMYHGWRQTWQGLTKNAYEGIANERLILPFTALMILGYVLPTLLLFFLLLSSFPISHLALAAWLVSYLPRLLAAHRFDGAWLAAMLFPFSILLFLSLQWWALLRHQMGTESTWRGRAYPAASS